MYVDSHCHLEMDTYDDDRNTVIEKSIQEGLQYMLTVGTEEKHFNTVIEIINEQKPRRRMGSNHPARRKCR